MKNMAILKAMADASGEVLYMFADDFKDFFNQFRVAAHQRYLTWYLGSNIVTSSGSLQDTFLYLLVSHSAPIVRAQDKGARIFGVGCLCYWVIKLL